MRFKDHLKKRFGKSSTPVKSNSDTTPVETPAERLGLLQVGETVAAAPSQEQFNVDIIAVHGLNGDAYTTWTNSNGTFWLRDLLPASLPGCRIYSYGYPSQVVFSSSLATVRDYSRRLLASIKRIQEEQPSEARIPYRDR